MFLEKENLKKLLKFMRNAGFNGTIESNSNNREEFFAERIKSASRGKTLLDFAENLCEEVGTSMSKIGTDNSVAILELSLHHSESLMNWLRKYPKIASMLCFIKQDLFEQSIDCVNVEIVDKINDRLSPILTPKYQIPIKVELLTPLAHNSDKNNGNIVLFRRKNILSESSNQITVPFYSGNALRGIMRDLLADYLISALDLKVSNEKPAVLLWFYHALYAGGVLSEGGGRKTAIQAETGDNNSVKSEGIRTFRDTIPSLSLLGVALQDKIIQGRLQVGDLRPKCYEWGNGETSFYELMTTDFNTKHDKFEGKVSKKSKKKETLDEQSSDAETTTSMIYHAEYLKEGVILEGGVDYDSHIQPLELSCLGLGLELLIERGYLGGQNNKGKGKCLIQAENLPNSTLYKTFIADNKSQITSYLMQIGAL